jgi:hypothetical protein
LAPTSGENLHTTTVISTIGNISLCFYLFIFSGLNLASYDWQKQLLSAHAGNGWSSIFAGDLNLQSLGYV